MDQIEAFTLLSISSDMAEGFPQDDHSDYEVSVCTLCYYGMPVASSHEKNVIKAAFA